MFGENPFAPARPAEGERMAGMNQFGVFFSLILPALAAGAAAGATVMAALFKRMMARERRCGKSAGPGRSSLPQELGKPAPERLNLLKNINKKKSRILTAGGWLPNTFALEART